MPWLYTDDSIKPCLFFRKNDFDAAVIVRAKIDCVHVNPTANTAASLHLDVGSPTATRYRPGGYRAVEKDPSAAVEIGTGLPCADQ